MKAPIRMLVSAKSALPHWWRSHITLQPISFHSMWYLQQNGKPKCQGTKRNLLLRCKDKVFQLWHVCRRKMAIAAYIKECPCIFQDELAGVRLVFAVGDIHLKFICLWKQTSREKQDKVFFCPHSLSLRLSRTSTSDKTLKQRENYELILSSSSYFTWAVLREWGAPYNSYVKLFF